MTWLSAIQFSQLVTCTLNNAEPSERAQRGRNPSLFDRRREKTKAMKAALEGEYSGRLKEDGCRSVWLRASFLSAGDQLLGRRVWLKIRPLGSLKRFHGRSATSR